MSYAINTLSPTMRLTDAVGMGLIPGARRINKLGYNADINGTTQEDLWAPGGTMTVLVGAQALEVVSTDNTNDKAAGTGALTVKISYLTTAYVEKSEIVTMNGTVAVATTATDIFRVNNFRVETAGATGAATGTISLRRSGAGTNVSQIIPTQTRARNSMFTVPTGYKFIITSVSVGTGAATVAAAYGKFTLRAYYSEISQLKTTLEYPLIELVAQASAAVATDLSSAIPEGVDIRMTVIGNASTSAMAANSSMDGILVPL